MEQPLGQVRRRFAPLHAVVRRMDRQPVAAAGHSRHLRHLHIEIHVSPVLAQTQRAQANQQNLPQSVGMGRSDCVRYGRGDADPHLCVRYVRHSDSVDGKKPARGRLSAREQTGIRSGDAQYAAVVPYTTRCLCRKRKSRSSNGSSGPTTGYRGGGASSATIRSCSIFRPATRWR